MLKNSFAKIIKKSIAVFLALVMLLTSFVPNLSTPFSPKEADAAGISCGSGSSGALSSNLQARVGGVALDQAATFLANMDDITGAYYDANLDRIVFVGKKNTTLPNFDKDDLAVAIKSFVFNRSIPAVSIEPPDSADPNMMRVFYYGGIENTRFGKVMFDSDYALKFYLNGYDVNDNRINSSVPGYKPVIERYIDKNPSGTTFSLSSRWWIVPKLMSLKRDDSTDSFVFDQAIMEVQAEQLSGNNDPKWVEASNEFAQHHTQYFDQFATETPVYAEAKQLGKIVSIVKWLVDRNIATDFNWARDYAPKIVATPKKVPLESFQGSYNGWNYTSSGGVIYDTPNSYTSDTTQASSLRSASQAVPTTKEDINWTFTKDGQQYESVAVAADAFRTLGSYNTTVADMDFPTAGDLSLAFQRSYSSYSGGQYGVGRGWNIFPAKLINNKPGWQVVCASGQTGNHPWKLALQTPGGMFETFTYFNCSIGYKPDDPAHHSQMFHNADGTLTARLKDQTEYKFDAGYKLTQMRDKNGNTISYNYDSEAKLVGIVDSKAHKITVNYSVVNGQKLISSIQDWSGRIVNYTYDAQGNLLTVKDPKGNVTTYTYDSNFKLANITDREGKVVVTNTYTPEAKLATQRDSANITKTYSHNDTSKTITVNDNLGRIQKTVYDEKARILQKIDPLIKNITYTYGAEPMPLTIKDKNGNTTTFTYDSSGNMLSVKYPNNKIINFSYDTKNRLTKLTDSRYGAQVKNTDYTYDVNGNIIKIIEDLINEKKFTYNVEGEALSYSDPMGHLTKWTRDSFGNKLTETPFYDVRTSNFAYDNLGRLIKKTDGEGKTNTYTYDTNGNVLSLNDGIGTTQNIYNKENRLLRSTLPNNFATNFAYNPAGSLTNVIDALSGVTSYSYDGYQNLITRQDALNRQTKYVYDILNRRTQATTPLGNVAKWEYDANGNLTKRIDEANNATVYQYDNLNRLIKINYPDLKTVTMTYDDRSNLIQMSDPSGITTYTYDRFDRLTQVQNPNGIIKYEYDLSGKLARITYPDNKSVSYGYDSDNTLLRITDWNNQKVDFARHKNGLPQMKVMPNGTIASYSYDLANRLKVLEYRKGTELIAKFSYERDNLGNVTKATEEGSYFSTTTPTPTPTNSLTPVPTNSPTPTPVSTSTPTPRPTTATTPTAPPTPTPVSPSNEPDLVITGISTAPLNPAPYAFFNINLSIKNQGTIAISNQTLVISSYHDLTQLPIYSTPINNNSAVSVALLPGETKSYSISTNYFSTTGSHKVYAMVDQQKHVVESNEDNNAAGPHNMTIASSALFKNILARFGLKNFMGIFSGSTAYAQVNIPKFINAYSYDALGRVLSASQSATNNNFVYTYDKVGNRLTDKVNNVASNYTYNLDNQLSTKDTTTYVHDKRGNQTGVGSKTFNFNFDNKLIKYVNSNVTTEYSYDGLNNRLSQKVNTTTTQFVNDISGDLTKVLVAKNLSTGISNFYVHGPEIISEGDAGATSRKYYLYDGLGNIRFTSDSNGNKLQAFNYDPYGNPIGANNGSNFKYKGEQADQGGMYFMRARYYDPTTGRFISKDPVEGMIGNPQSQNGYNFANANPVNLSDPSGEFAIVPVLLVAWAVAEIGLTASDANDFANTMQDPNANVCDKAWSGALLAAGLIGPGGGYGKGAKVIQNILDTRWYKGTFNTVEDSARYHLGKHGKGRSLEEYTNAGVEFFNKNKDKAVKTTLNDGSPGLKVESGGQGGYFTPDGKVVTYWD